MLQRLGTSLLSFTAFLHTCEATDERIRIDPSTGLFIGPDGRTRLFHGVNVVQKSFPWHPSLGEFDPSSSLNAKDIEDLSSWGFNVVRLGVMWPGVEPSPGQYNTTYLKIMRQLVDDMYSKQIYTIVDFHQDCMSEMWCGEGIPAWMVPMLEPLMTSCKGVGADIAKLIGQCKSFAEFNYKRDPATGFPLTSECLKVTFDAYSRTPELVSAWGHFYKNVTIQSKFRDFWKTVATTFAGSPGVLGYDLINEPLNGNFFTEPKNLIPGHLDQMYLQPLYTALHDVIRSVDPAAIVMYEPPPFPDTYPNTIPIEHGVHPVGFTSGPAGKDVAHQALSYHIYSCGFADQNCDRQGDTKELHCPVCDEYATDAVHTRRDDATKLGGGIFLTEFGACSGSEKCLAEIARVTSRADAAWHSWAYWQFKYNHDITTVSGPIEGFYTDDGKLQEAKVAALSRTYAPVVAGSPVHMQYEPSTAAFRLVYDTEKNTQNLATEIFLNEDMNYKSKGYIVRALNATVNATGPNRLEVVAHGEGRVDLAIVRPYSGNLSGSLRSNDPSDALSWQLSDDESSPGFEFSSVSKVTWWKMIKVYSDDRQLVCILSTQDSDHGPKVCNLGNHLRHGFLFNYNIELWKAKKLGIHTHVGTVSSSTFGPLLGKRLKLKWEEDTASTRVEVLV